MNLSLKLALLLLLSQFWNFCGEPSVDRFQPRFLQRLSNCPSAINLWNLGPFCWIFLIRWVVSSHFIFSISFHLPFYCITNNPHPSSITHSDYNCFHSQLIIYSPFTHLLSLTYFTSSLFSPTSLLHTFYLQTSTNNIFLIRLRWQTY